MSKVHFRIYAISLIDLLAVGLIVPLFPLHLRSIGASHTTIGLLGSLYSALQVFTGPLVGSWSDTRGRKYVACRTLLLCSVCYVLIGLTSSIFVIFILRFLLGLAKHTQTLLKAIIADCYPREKHAEIFGFCSAIGSLGFVVGPVIGGHLSEFQHGFYYISTSASLLFVINIILIYSMEIPMKTDSSTTESFDIKSDLFKAVTNLTRINWYVYWDTFILRFLFGFAISIYFSNQSLYIQTKFDLSQKSVGYLISFVSIIASVSGLTLGIITSTFYFNDKDCYKRLSHGFFMLTFTLIALYVAPNIYFFITVLVPFGMANAVLRNVSLEAILVKCEHSERGSLSGAVGSVMSVSRFASPILSGIVGDLYGEQKVIVLAFLPSLLGLLLCTCFLNIRKELSENRTKLD